MVKCWTNSRRPKHAFGLLSIWFIYFFDYYNSPGLIFQWTRSTLLVISPIHTCHVLIMCISGPCITKHCNTSIVSSFRYLWSSSKTTILIFLASESLVCLSLSLNQYTLIVWSFVLFYISKVLSSQTLRQTLLLDDSQPLHTNNYHVTRLTKLNCYCFIFGIQVLACDCSSNILFNLVRH